VIVSASSYGTGFEVHKLNMQNTHSVDRVELFADLIQWYDELQDGVKICSLFYNSVVGDYASSIQVDKDMSLERSTFAGI